MGRLHKFLIYLSLAGLLWGCQRESAPSTEPRLPAPTEVVASLGDFDARIVVHWLPAPGAHSYQIWRATYKNLANVGLVASGLTATEFTDEHIEPSRNYFYWIVAEGDADASDYSLPGMGYAGPLGDPLLDYQWHLNNSGQTAFSDHGGVTGMDIAIAQSAQAGYFGQNIKLAIVDVSVQIDHPDLAANLLEHGYWSFQTGAQFNGEALTDAHATAVAGLAAAVGWNNTGGRGIAPKARFASIALMDEYSVENEVYALGGGGESFDYDIFNRSYGTESDADELMDPLVDAQLRYGVEHLRHGRGALYVKAAGNGFGTYGLAQCRYANATRLSCQNANMDPDNATPWNIVVGALNADGVKASYSTTGSSLWVSAPGGELGYSTARGWRPNLPAEYFQPGVVTADLAGCRRGYSQTSAEWAPLNAFEDNSNGINENCDYTSTFTGTSAAAPVVSGALAVILSANDTLSWRDVRRILVDTSDIVDARSTGVTIPLSDGDFRAEEGWVTNAAGIHFHNAYGFGKLNVDRAVALAQGYDRVLGALVETPWHDSGVIDKAIPDNSVVGASNSITVPAGLIVESVQVRVDITHPYTGDLSIEVVSPSGTRSILLNGLNGLGPDKNLQAMVLLSNAFYDEPAGGAWTIKVVDTMYKFDGVLNQWGIKLFGHAG